MKLKLFFSALAPASLLVAYVLLTSPSASEGEPGSPMTATVTSGPIEEEVLALGTLEPSSMVRVGAQVSGQIKTVHIRTGETVQRGELLAEIDAVPQQNALRVAQAKVEDMKAQRRVKQIKMEHAGSTFRRQHSLIEQNAVSRTVLEEAQVTFETLKAELASLDAQIKLSEVDLETAETNLAYTRITAPMDGKVVAVPVEQGQTLNSVQTAPTVAVVANLDEMVVKVRISEADVWRTTPGQGAWFTIIGEPQARYHASLEAVDFAPPSIAKETTPETAQDAAKESAVYYHGIIRVKNTAGKLRTKMTAQVHITVGRAEDALRVPWSALSVRQSDGSHLVKVREKDGAVKERKIKIGLTDRVQAQVLEGLRLGETVLLNQAAPLPAD
ncbi:efflux RND transporter periplasmic adaptor subunit [Ensifer sp. ENS06]|uniref:efflux RND transporter periplasmic adaptor subunit n=1 Tax=Ensifer sp. ENS06 TaxID=2769276 RepID=UPI0017822C88|nr:efflux RND transporter periplasmic adaptor subunit [Ensifer sp. ENS06]MBD9627009.1 efflux RND transporter periplasmic adaptor subunit [Ensifer sp. ENS06]